MNTLVGLLVFIFVVLPIVGTVLMFVLHLVALPFTAAADAAAARRAHRETELLQARARVSAAQQPRASDALNVVQQPRSCVACGLPYSPDAMEMDCPASNTYYRLHRFRVS